MSVECTGWDKRELLWGPLGFTSLGDAAGAYPGEVLTLYWGHSVELGAGACTCVLGQEARPQRSSAQGEASSLFGLEFEAPKASGAALGSCRRGLSSSCGLGSHGRPVCCPGTWGLPCVTCRAGTNSRRLPSLCVFTYKWGWSTETRGSKVESAAPIGDGSRSSWDAGWTPDPGR